MLTLANIQRPSEQPKTIIIGRAQHPILPILDHEAGLAHWIHEVPDGEHSPLGPSSAERWINCPASVKATAGVPDSPSMYALEGTAAHYVSELCRLSGNRAEYYRGHTIRIKTSHGPFDIEVDDEMVDSVNTFVEHVSELQGMPLYEARVNYTAWVPQGFGTSDDSRLFEVCTITDFKHGKGKQVFAANNSQLKLYALGLYHDYGWLYNFKKFVLTICQPRLDWIDTWEISLEDLLKWADETLPKAVKEVEEGTRFNPGAWCSNNFCRIRATCRARAESHMRDALGDFDNLDEAIEIAAPLAKKETRAAELEQLQPQELARILRVVDGIKSWCGDVQKWAMRMIQNGADVGMKLVEGRSSRAWSVADVLVEAALKNQGINTDELYEKKILSPSKAEKKFGKKKVAATGLVKKPPGKPKLAPLDDSRPAISSDALSDFESLDADEDE